jgi:two-component system, cell cycle sensor histidine kinase and response regulator CckA
MALFANGYRIDIHLTFDIFSTFGVEGSTLDLCSKTGIFSIFIKGGWSIISLPAARYTCMRLRTKFLLSLLLVTAGLTCAALLVVRHTAEAHMQEEIEGNANTAIRTFQFVEHQEQLTLAHKADLLAALAEMRNGDPSAIDDTSQDPWQSDDFNLFGLADRAGTMLALRTTDPGFSLQNAQLQLRRMQSRRVTSGWWYSGGRLYEVALQPIYSGASRDTGSMGTVIVGHEVDARQAADLRGISSAEVVFRYAGQTVASTLSSLQEMQVARQLGPKPVSKQIQIDGKLYWAHSAKLTPVAGAPVSLVILESYGNTAAFLAHVNHLLLGLGLTAIFIGGALAFMISDAFARPLARLADGVSALERGDYTYPLRAYGADEVARVTRAFDRMRRVLRSNEAKRQQLETQLRQSQRMEALGRLAGGVAHDFNNLLTIIKGYSDIVLQGLSPADACFRHGQQIGKAIDRASALTRQLLAFSRMQVLEPKIVDLNLLVADMGKMLTRLIREDIAFSFEPDGTLGRVKADPGQLEQVLLNLTVNACDAMPRGGVLAIETRNVSVGENLAAQARPVIPAGEYVLLTVADTGQGMEAETKARIFEPFFTTKEPGKGTGLGLATVYGVVKQSGGYVWVESEPGKGAKFEIYLPRVDEQVEQPPVPRPNVAVVRGHETVLIVEDETAVRELATEFLRSAGYSVLAAQDGNEAISIAKESTAPIHVLLTDVVMPGMRGPELAEKLKRVRPRIKVVYMSGYLDYAEGDGEFLGGNSFLQKPYSRDTLVNKIAEVVAGAAKPQERISSALPQAFVN